MPIVSSAWASKVKLARTLEHAFHFTPLALEANREGRLSPEQVAPLISRILEPLGATALSLVFWAAFWLIYVVAILHRPLGEFQHEFLSRFIHPQTIMATQWANIAYDRSPLVYSGAVLSFLFLCLHGLTRISLKLVLDVIAGRVERVEGRVIKGEEERKTRGGDAGKMRYYYRTRDDEDFDVSRIAYLALDSGGAYSLFYLPRSHVLVAVEPNLDTGRLPKPLSAQPLPRLDFSK